MAVVAPIGAVMGLDIATPGIMRRKPRPFDQAIIVRSMMIRLFVAGLFMAVGTLILVQIGKTTYDSLEIGQTMAVVGLSVMNIFLALNLRYPEDSAFGSATLSNPKLLWAFAWAFLGAILITQSRVMQDLFNTTALTGNQWAICLVPGVALLVVGGVLQAHPPRTSRQPGTDSSNPGRDSARRLSGHVRGSHSSAQPTGQAARRVLARAVRHRCPDDARRRGSSHAARVGRVQRRPRMLLAEEVPPG